MHNSCTKDCRELVVIGCAHSTVVKWVSVFWGRKESGKQNRCWPVIQLWQLTVSVCISCEKTLLGMNMCRTIKWDWYWFIYQPENVMQSLKVSKYMLICYQIVCQRYARTFGNCQTSTEFLWMWRWTAGSLQIMIYGSIHMNLTWRSDSDVNSVASDHHICANIDRNMVSWKSCLVSVMIARVFYCTCPSWHGSKHCLLSHWQDSDRLV